MNLDTKGTFISMFQLAEKGELTNLEQKHVIEALVSFGNSINPNDIDEKFKNIRVGSRTLFEQTENCIDTALSIIKGYNKTFEDAKLSLQNMPKGAIYGDDTETLEFIKSLTEDAYNFSQAKRLTGIARQTIKKHADNGKYGLRTIWIGKSEYISKKALIDYYRTYFGKNSYNF